MSLKVTVGWKGRNLPKEWPKFANQIEPFLEMAHKKCALRIVADAVAWSRVDTGLMRAGWLPYLIQNGYPYSNLLGTGSANYQGITAGPGTFREYPMRTIITNAVAYTQFVDSKVGIFDTEGKSAYMRAPVEHLEQAGMRWSGNYARMMQSCIDFYSEAWNRGEKDFSKVEPEDPGPPSGMD